jgi:mannose-6-phosphate isomerase-like protein (cupin superfamily)
MAIEAGKTYVNPRSGARATLTEHWKDTGGARTVLERVVPPGTGKAAPHYHLDFFQTWEILGGTATMSVEGKQRTLSAGERVELPQGTPHADPWNEGTEDMTMRLTIEPVPQFVEAYAEAWVAGFEKGTLNDQDELPLLHVLAIAHATDGESYAAGPPRWLQSALLPLAAAVARLRGYRVPVTNKG